MKIRQQWGSSAFMLPPGIIDSEKFIINLKEGTVQSELGSFLIIQRDETDDSEVSDIELIHPGFHLPPSLHILSDCLRVDNAQIEHLSRRSCLIVDPGLYDGLSMVLKTAKNHDCALLYFDLCEEVAWRRFQLERGQDLSAGSPLSIMIEQAAAIKPAFLLLDGFELLQTSHNWKDFDQQEFQVYLMNVLSNSDTNIRIAAITREDLSFVRLKNWFQKIILVEPPTLQERLHFLNEQGCIGDIKVMAGKSHGYSYYDLAQMHLNNQPLREDINNLLSGLKITDENVRRDNSIIKTERNITKNTTMHTEFETIPRSIQWHQLGGYSALKQKLFRLIDWPITHPDSFTRLGIAAPSGILLYGPSGCGKTMLVHALATKLSLGFLSAKTHQIYSKYLGDSEAAIRRLFAAARKASPCILFIDSIDTIGSRREWDEDGQSGVNERVLSTLLNEMDGVGNVAGGKSEGVIVIAATCRPHLLDDALTRPGRLDHCLMVPLPSSQDRLEILQSLFEDVELDWVVDRTEGWSCADLVILKREAGIKAISEGIIGAIYLDHIKTAINCTHWRPGSNDVSVFEKFENKR